MLIGIDASRAFISQKTGTENYSYNLICALARIDDKNRWRLYVKNHKDSNFARLPNNFQFVPIPLPRFWTQLGLARECLLHPPQILFIPAHTLPLIRRPNLKTVVTIHDLGAEFLPGYHTFPQKLYLNFSTKYAVKNAQGLIAVSESTKKDLIEKFGADSRKVFVVHEGIDQKRFKVKGERGKVEKILAKYKIKKPYILFVGTLQPRKNLERLIEALAKLGGRGKVEEGDLNLVIVGKKGWMYDQILAAPKKFGVGDKVKFLNYIPDSNLPIIYSQAEVFVLPSLVEGFGLPVLEAMAAQIPVIVSNKGSLPEVAGEAALYFNPENVDEIAKTLTKVLFNSKLRSQMIEKGRKRLAKFSWERAARKTLKVFERVWREG